MLINQLTTSKINKIVSTYGTESQLLKAIEELSELTVEICKARSIKDITSEIADVYIMLEQLLIIYEIDNEDLKNEIFFKVNRQIERIKARQEVDLA